MFDPAKLTVEDKQKLVEHLEAKLAAWPRQKKRDGSGKTDSCGPNHSRAVLFFARRDYAEAVTRYSVLLGNFNLSEIMGVGQKARSDSPSQC